MDLLKQISQVMLPEAIIALIIIICSILIFAIPKRQNIIYYVATGGILAALLSFKFMPIMLDQTALWQSFSSNIFTILFRILILLGTLLTIQMSKKYISGFGESKGEFYTLLLIAALGAMLLSGANDLIMIFIAMETLSISSFALCGYTKLDKLSNEAALKYIIFGSASTAILLYGLSLLYGITGETNLIEITRYIQLSYPTYVLFVAFIMILGGFGFKIAAVPAHSWAPDVYQGAPIPVAAFLSVVSKLAGFAVIIRVIPLFIPNNPIWSLSIAILALLTITIGNLAAINQSNIRRLMAYSSIAQAGYVLLGLSVASKLGISSMIFYLITYLFTNFGTWAAIEIYANQTGKDSIEAFDGLAFKQPTLAAGLTLCLLSLAGIPITAGFFGKFYLFQAIAFAGPDFLAILIIALINTVIAIYYYLRIVKAMFLKPQSIVPQHAVLPSSKSLNSVLGFTVAGVVLVGLLASPIISLTETSASKITPYVGMVQLIPGKPPKRPKPLKPPRRPEPPKPARIRDLQIKSNPIDMGNLR